MPADIDPQHLFFQCQKFFLIVFFQIRHPDLKFFFDVIGCDVKKGHLPCHGRFFITADPIHDGWEYRDHLVAVAVQSIHGSRLDEVFYRTLVDFLAADTL